MLSTVWIPQRCSQSYTEKREEGDSSGCEDKGGIKKRETDSASNQFANCSPQLGTPKTFTELGREEKGEGGDRGDLVEKKESPEGKRAIKPVISLPS